MQFQAGLTVIGSPVPVNADGVATTTTTFPLAGSDTLSAAFTPADPTAYNTSSGTLTLPVNAPPSSGTIPLAVTAPAVGAFVLTVDTTGTVSFKVSGLSATATATPIIASDTRNTYPGWSLAGQDTNWTGSGTATGATMSGNQLGWTPTITGTPPPGVDLGSPTAPSNPGLGSGAVLASASPGFPNGFGNATLGANLILVFPASQVAGPYTASLTITAITSGP